MGKIAINEVDNYNNSGTNFFKLENDKDTAKVRFMYNTIDDVQLDVVHEITVGDKTRLVNCLRSYDEPIDNCPLCKAGIKPQVKLFVPLYNEASGEVQFWQRGKTFINSISGMCSRYNPLVGTVIEIERNGKKGEQTTRYQLYPCGTDNTTIEDLPEIPDTLNSMIMDKSFDELTKYVERGCFDDASNGSKVAESGIARRQPINSGRKPF